MALAPPPEQKPEWDIAVWIDTVVVGGMSVGGHGAFMVRTRVGDIFRIESGPVPIEGSPLPEFFGGSWNNVSVRQQRTWGSNNPAAVQDWHLTGVDLCDTVDRMLGVAGDKERTESNTNRYYATGPNSNTTLSEIFRETKVPVPLWRLLFYRLPFPWTPLPGWVG